MIEIAKCFSKIVLEISRIEVPELSCLNADRVECLGLNPDWNLDSNELLER
jgi:hypothetical protein